MSKSNKTDDLPAIIVKGVSKSFRIPLDGSSGIKQKVVNIFRNKKGFRDFTPLNDISFEIIKGEFFGIVGRNGSGKSTLLKTMAGIYSPEKGYVKVNGSLVPFIELGVGFNPELTGRENIYLNGALLGFSRDEITEMYDEVVDFAELHEFMGERLKNYSSGMQVRLAFSIAIQAKGDILLLDEVLAVGDSAFQQKCLLYFAKLKREKRTVILVSHSMAAVERYCDRALLLENGRILDLDESKKIADKYENLFVLNKNESKNSGIGVDTTASVYALVDVIQDNKQVSIAKSLTPIKIVVKVHSKIIINSMNVGLNIRDEKGQVVFSMDSRKQVGDLNFAKLTNEPITLDFTVDNYYNNGRYTIDVNVVDEDAEKDRLLSRQMSVALFDIIGIKDHTHSLFHPGVKIEVADD